MGDDTKWLIGLALTFGIATIGFVITAFSRLSAKLSKSIFHLHQRVDTVKEKYVRRDDLENHLKRLDASVESIQKEMHENHSEILRLLNSK